MKASVPLVVVAAAVVSAQNSTNSAVMTPLAYSAGPVPLAVSLSTSTWDDCTTLPDTTITSYETATVTYCPECEMMTMGGTTLTSYDTATMTYCPECEMGGQTVHTTVWTTTWSSWCPTGTVLSGSTAYMAPYTVTVTESCTMATPTWSTGGVPSGYTTESQVCTMCGGMELTAMMTFPITCSTYPPGVTRATMMPTPGSPGMPAMPSPWTSTWESSASGESPVTWETPLPAAPMTTPAPVPASTAYRMTSEPPMSPVTSGVAYSSGWVAPSVWGNTTGITSYTGSAANLSLGWASALVMFIGIIAGAFLL